MQDKPAEPPRSRFWWHHLRSTKLLLSCCHAHEGLRLLMKWSLKFLVGLDTLT